MVWVDGEGLAAPLASRATVSFVEVSPSTLMELKLCAVACVRRDSHADGERDTSVQRMARSVAMFGWIIPAPFVIPARAYVVDGCEGRVKVVESSFGKVSVVQIAVAVESQASWVDERLQCARGMPLRILRMGRR